MSKLPVTEFTFKLTSPISFAHKGEQEFSFELKLKAPKGKHRANLIRLKQGFFRSILEQSKANSPTQAAAPPIDPDAPEFEWTSKIIMNAIYMSSIDIVALEAEFKSLLCADLAEVHPGIALTSFMVDNDLAHEDFEELMGEYIAVFIASALT